MNYVESGVDLKKPCRVYSHSVLNSIAFVRKLQEVLGLYNITTVGEAAEFLTKPAVSALINNTISSIQSDYPVGVNS